jgi:hypothetical protein
MNYFYKKEIRYETIVRTVELVDVHGTVVGDCTISGNAVTGTNECLDTGNTCSLTISIEPEFQSYGHSRRMWQVMCRCLEHEYPIRSDQLFFIDADASAGYWDHIGMTLNRYGYDYHGTRELEGRGYLKCITYSQLKRSAF